MGKPTKYQPSGENSAFLCPHCFDKDGLHVVVNDEAVEFQDDNRLFTQDKLFCVMCKYETIGSKYASWRKKFDERSSK